VLVTGPAIGKWVAEQTGGEWYGQGVGIGVKDGDTILSGVLVDTWNEASCCAHIACAKPGREFLHLIGYSFNYMFYRLGAKVVIGRIAESNTKCRRLVRKMGFTEAARIPDACPDGALMIYTITPMECRYL